MYNIYKNVIVGDIVKMDGGYYAIKGFCFQYDRTILNILSNTELDDVIDIEQKEDVSDKRTIYQIKYREAANFLPSTIKKPVCQLIEIFKTDKRDIVLYAYFQDQEKKLKKLTIEELNQIIGNCKIKTKQYIFDESLKKEFIGKFTLVFSENYINQFENVINKVKETFMCDEENALIIYPQIYKYIESKVIYNNPENAYKRTCTKRELIEHIKKNSEIMFLSAYSEFIGKDRYLSLIKKKYFIESNISPIERIFIIEVEKDIPVYELKGITLVLKNRFYKPYKQMIKSPAPYILFRGVDSKKLIELKSELAGEGINFRDGYGFYGSDFAIKNITEKCTVHNNISVKFVNDEAFLEVVVDSIGTTKNMFHFSNKDSNSIESKHNHVKINIESATDVIQILK